MKNLIGLTFALTIAITIGCLAIITITAGCSGAIDKVVDNQIAKMVEEENKKLPTNVSHGVKLIKIDYSADTNRLNMRYSVPNQGKFEANFTRIKTETNEEVYDNGSLNRAFDHGIRLFHEFYTDDELSGKPFKSFQTPKPR